MTCTNEDCKKETNEGYKYCMDCYNKWKENQPAEEDPYKSKPWAEDPVVDALLKINNNLGKIVRALENKRE